MRERLLAVGCGGLCLMLAFMLGGLAIAGTATGNRTVIAAWVMMTLFVVGALAGFALAIRRGVDDEDLFEGKRGTAVAMTIVVVLAVVACTLALYFNADFWRGMLRE